MGVRDNTDRVRLAYSSSLPDRVNAILYPLCWPGIDQQEAWDRYAEECITHSTRESEEEVVAIRKLERRTQEIRSLMEAPKGVRF